MQTDSWLPSVQLSNFWNIGYLSSDSHQPYLTDHFSWEILATDAALQIYQHPGLLPTRTYNLLHMKLGLLSYNIPKSILDVRYEVVHDALDVKPEDKDKAATKLPQQEALGSFGDITFHG